MCLPTRASHNLSTIPPKVPVGAGLVPAHARLQSVSAIPPKVPVGAGLVPAHARLQSVSAIPQSAPLGSGLVPALCPPKRPSPPPAKSRPWPLPYVSPRAPNQLQSPPTLVPRQTLPTPNMACTHIASKIWRAPSSMVDCGAVCLPVSLRRDWVPRSDDGPNSDSRFSVRGESARRRKRRKRGHRNFRRWPCKG